MPVYNELIGLRELVRQLGEFKACLVARAPTAEHSPNLVREQPTTTWLRNRGDQ